MQLLSLSGIAEDVRFDSAGGPAEKEHLLEMVIAADVEAADRAEVVFTSAVCMPGEGERDVGRSHPGGPAARRPDGARPVRWSSHLRPDDPGTKWTRSSPMSACGFPSRS
jgi:hypothetical protein